MAGSVINVTIKTTQGFLKRQLTKVGNFSKKQTFLLAEATVLAIQQTIRDNVRRPGSTGRLAEAFFAEEITNGYGVGRISFLNQEVPYWRHINYGSLAINANWQHRVPNGQFSPGNPMPITGEFRNGRWQTGGGQYSFIPKNPIPPMNYIEKALAKVFAKSQTIIRG